MRETDLRRHRGNLKVSTALALRLSAAPIVLRGGEKTVTFVCMQTKKSGMCEREGEKREKEHELLRA